METIFHLSNLYPTSGISATISLPHLFPQPIDDCIFNDVNFIYTDYSFFLPSHFYSIQTTCKQITICYLMAYHLMWQFDYRVFQPIANTRKTKWDFPLNCFHLVFCCFFFFQFPLKRAVKPKGNEIKTHTESEKERERKGDTKEQKENEFTHKCQIYRMKIVSNSLISCI